MSLPDRDVSVLRRLAEEVAEIAALPVHQETAAEWQRLNDLRPGRPLVWVNEICWHEMDYEGELTLQCEEEFARGLETGLRQTLYQWRHLRGDMIVDPVVWCPVVVENTGFGMAAECDRSEVDERGSLGAARYRGQFQTEADVEKIRVPEISVDAEATERNFERMSEAFAGIMPVEKRGVGMIWFAPWDALIQWWGVQQAMEDLILRPELVHAAMERLVGAYLRMLEQYEALNLLRREDGNDRIGSGGLGYVSDLPQGDFDPGRVRPVDQWGCATAQIFSEVSPAMHEEFALRYERRWLERFGLTYYGCCEPLHHKMGVLGSVKNLRKVSMGFRADLERGAEALGDRYVFSYKPNPAILAEERWHPERARQSYREALEKTRGCVVEIILKDLTTVRWEPQRLWEWTQIAQEEAERAG